MGLVKGQTVIVKCKCQHEFQDKHYGKGNRVHNVGGTKQTITGRCTICQDEKNIGGS